MYHMGIARCKHILCLTRRSMLRIYKEAPGHSPGLNNPRLVMHMAFNLLLAGGLTATFLGAVAHLEERIRSLVSKAE
jgi:hypothetical protein